MTPFVVFPRINATRDEQALLALISATSSAGNRPYKVKKKILKALAKHEWIVVDEQGGFRITGQGHSKAFDVAKRFL
jgi:hypothetical protein